MVNNLLRVGKRIHREQLSYKSCQRNFGKSVGLRALGIFVAALKRKTANAGGRVEEINTYKTKLSQTCYSGHQEKVPLKQRWHQCNYGMKAQRDLYSA